ncbi:MAG: long-chain fatty acid--CoA ligase [Sphingomonadales bacterium]|nr:long-chain fatty acid--CoA ligase [Sphingomonadales bacterium]MBK9004899.1 long-chain fatty acid--CoA ligase [Sphingomonadales bacterium]MBK9267371.1 long-chain fatty acid--CoA ligase [Sphingomonadales bacterium]MBP6434068.1 long-chain fatty acid--CoA ligase [Sphingorhabdus sp.]
MQLTQGVHRSARIRPHGIATIDGPRQRSWAEVADDVARMAALLRDLGIANDDRVAVLAANSDHYFDAYFAIFWAGAVIVPLNTRLSVPELQFQLRDVGAKALLVGDGFEEQAQALAAECPNLLVEQLDEAGGSLRHRAALLAPLEDAGRSDGDLAGVFYTGGTTGLPKGVMLTHRNLVSVANNLIMMIHFDPLCVNLHCAPMFHLADIGLFSVTMTGGTHVFAQRIDPATILDLTTRHRATHVFTVPAVIDALTHADLAAHDLSSLKMLGYGGSPMPAATIARAQERLPGVAFIQGFGMTEMPSLTFLLPEHHCIETGLSKLRTAGIPGYGFEVKIVDAEGNEVPRGQVGEIVGRGPCVMAGYWNRPEETASALRDGWMHSQDAGFMDEDGFITITDRLKDMIVSGAENIYSIEVENALSLHQQVRECAVIGLPDERWGERVHAIVVPMEGMQPDPADLLAHLQQRLARYKCPKTWELRSEPLPRSPIGKVLKAELRAHYNTLQGAVSDV